MITIPSGMTKRIQQRRNRPAGNRACRPISSWDCGDGDGVVGIDDFLAMLATWGTTGVSCDFDGNSVGIKDFLLLLANWGPCP